MNPLYKGCNNIHLHKLVKWMWSRATGLGGTTIKFHCFSMIESVILYTFMYVLPNIYQVISNSFRNFPRQVMDDETIQPVTC